MNTCVLPKALQGMCLGLWLCLLFLLVSCGKASPRQKSQAAAEKEVTTIDNVKVPDSSRAVDKPSKPRSSESANSGQFEIAMEGLYPDGLIAKRRESISRVFGREAQPILFIEWALVAEDDPAGPRVTPWIEYTLEDVKRSLPDYESLLLRDLPKYAAYLRGKQELFTNGERFPRSNESLGEFSVTAMTESKANEFRYRLGEGFDGYAEIPPHRAVITQIWMSVGLETDRHLVCYYFNP